MHSSDISYSKHCAFSVGSEEGSEVRKWGAQWLHFGWRGRMGILLGGLGGIVPQCDPIAANVVEQTSVLVSGCFKGWKGRTPSGGKFNY